MTTRSISPVGRAATALVLAGAGLSVTGGTAWADTTVPCGTPAHPALYTTTHHDAVPAVTHEVTVIDQAYVPGVAAVPEESHTETTWVDGDGTPEGDGWSATGDSNDHRGRPGLHRLRAGCARSSTRPPSRASRRCPPLTHERDRGRRGSPPRRTRPSSTPPPARRRRRGLPLRDRRRQGRLETRLVIDTPATRDAVEEVSHFDTVVDKAAWDETVVDTPAKPAVEEVSHFETVGRQGRLGRDRRRLDKAAWDETVVDDERVRVRPEERQRSGTRAPRPGTPARAAPAGRVRPTSTRPTPSPRRAVTHVVHHDAETHQVKVIDTPASPAVPAVTHVVHHAAETHQVKVIDTPASPAVPAVTHVVHHDAETHQVKVIDTPASPAVPAVTHVVHHDAVTRTVTVVDVPGRPGRRGRRGGLPRRDRLDAGLPRPRRRARAGPSPGRSSRTTPRPTSATSSRAPSSTSRPCRPSRRCPRCRTPRRSSTSPRSPPGTSRSW